MAIKQPKVEILGEATVRARWREDYRRRGRSPESEGSTKA